MNPKCWFSVLSTKEDVEDVTRVLVVVENEERRKQSKSGTACCCG